MADKSNTTSSLMNKLGESPGLVVAGLAAVATVSYLLFSRGGSKAAAAAVDSESDAAHEETLPEVLENSFFLEFADGAKKNEELITKWMQEQCNVLLNTNEDQKLALVDRKLSKEDYLRVMMII